MSHKKILLGIDNFKKLIDNNGYYIDKTLFIEDILNKQDQIILITRPRRFGKTLNMSMLKYFFENPECRQNNFENKDVSYIFNNLNIKKSEFYSKEFAKYPIVYLTFKSAKQNNWDETLYNLKEIIASEYERHSYILKKKILTQFQVKKYKRIINREAQDIEYTDAIINLTTYLKKYFKEDCFVLIDEYDTPIQAGYLDGYFDEVINFMKGMLVKGFKDNESLKQGILTGIMKVAQESIFSDFNNPSICTVLSNNYSDKFGFTENEVEEIIKYFNLNNNLNDIKNWYNGYIFGENTVIYNPWSIIKYVSAPENGLRPYWINTSDNRLIKDIIQLNKIDGKLVVEKLISNDVVQKEIEENVIYQSIKDSPEVGWSFLLHTGYLKAFNKFKKGYEENYSYEIAIPNLEIKTIYKKMIINYFKEEEKIFTNVERIIKSLIDVDINKFERLLKDLYIKQVSYYDTGLKKIEISDLDELDQDVKFESFHHGFLLGLFVQMESNYKVISNRECGLGRPDIIIVPDDKTKTAFIFKFKWESTRGFKTLDMLVMEAVKQISEKKYKEGLKAEFGHENIMCIGIGFKGKEIKILSDEPKSCLHS